MVQYILTIVICAGAAVYLGVHIYRSAKGKGSGCSRCPLKGNCSPKDRRLC